MPHTCPLCLHDWEEEETNLHHLVPRSRGGRAEVTVRLCRTCHKQLHALFTNKELARELGSVEALLAAERLQPYIRWARKARRAGHITTRRSKRRGE